MSERANSCGGGDHRCEPEELTNAFMKMDGAEHASASLCPNFPQVTEVMSEMWGLLFFNKEPSLQNFRYFVINILAL